MPCKIYLRHDQSTSQRETSKSDKVSVFAPSWVKEGAQILGKKLKGVEFTVLGRQTMKRARNSSQPKNSAEVLERFTIPEDFDNGNLIMLQKIARNEARNVNGKVNVSLYQPDISDVNLIYSIKDLARQTVVVGKDMTVTCGGYKSTKVKQEEPVYIIDLAALQFQQPCNSGRLVLIQENDRFKGPLDDFIFENVVGEKKKSYQEVTELISKNMEGAKTRYIKHEGYGKGGQNPCFMDSLAYKRFVKQDVLLSGLALVDLAKETGDKINFKFLKYGTGYFAGKFRASLNSLILYGVLDGIEELFDSYGSNVKDTIKGLTFPFYDADPASKVRLEELAKKYKIEYEFNRMDALKQTMPGKGVITAASNCADSNVACGNAMGFKATDGAISESLITKGNIFCPNLNSEMKYKYVEILK